MAQRCEVWILDLVCLRSPGTDNLSDSSPIRYVSSSSPTRSQNRGQRSDIPSSSSGLFVSRYSAGGRGSRRNDLHSGGLGSTPSRRRRVFVDGNGMPVADGEHGEPRSDATFSNIHPDTSEAEALGGSSTRVIWGTNISIQDSMSAFKNFLYNYATKYRLWADGATEDETRRMGDMAEEREYIAMLNTIRQLGVTSLSLDAKNLKAYPLTLKLWHQLHAYPQEIIPLMDQTVKDVMVELAIKEMEQLRTHNQRHQAHARDMSSVPPLSSDAMSEGGRMPQPEIPDIVAEVETKTFKVLPFGLDSTVNMRELDPAGMWYLFCIHSLDSFANRIY